MLPAEWIFKAVSITTANMLFQVIEEKLNVPYQIRPNDHFKAILHTSTVKQGFFK